MNDDDDDGVYNYNLKDCDEDVRLEPQTQSELPQLGARPREI